MNNMGLETILELRHFPFSLAQENQGSTIIADALIQPDKGFIPGTSGCPELGLQDLPVLDQPHVAGAGGEIALSGPDKLAVLVGEAAVQRQ